MYRGRHRFAKKRDANDIELRDRAVELGVEMVPIEEGPADYLAGICGHWVPVEIKNDKSGKRYGRKADDAEVELSPKQKKLRDAAAAGGLAFVVWYELADIEITVREIALSGPTAGARQARAAIATRRASGANGASIARRSSAVTKARSVPSD